MILSPAAQQEYERLCSQLPDGRDWQSHYVNLLEHLASRELPDVAVIEVRNRGLAAWEKSVEELKVARELKEHASMELDEFFGGDPQKNQDFEAFLQSLIRRPAAGHSRESEFEDLIRTCVELDILADGSRSWDKEPMDEQVTRRMKARLRFLKIHGVSEPAQIELRDMFNKLRKGVPQKNPLAEINVAKKLGQREKMEKMLLLLPHNNRSNETMSLATWRSEAETRLGISKRSFDRYKDALDGKYVEKPKGKFRVGKSLRDDS